MPPLKARDTTSGEVVEFNWLDPNPPTEQDLEEVFTEHRARKASAPAPEQPGFLEKFGNQFVRNVTGQEGFKYAKENPAQAGAAIAGLAAAPVMAGAALPVAAMMALEGIAAGGGAAIGQLTKEGQEGFQPGAAGRIATEVGKEGLMGAAMPGLGAAANQYILKPIGRGLYRLALNPGLATAKSPEAVEQLITTGIDEGINVSRKGMQKLDTLQKTVGGDVRKLIQSLETTANPQKAFQHLEALRNHYDSIGEVDRVASLDKLRDVYASKWQGQQLPVEQLHDLKIGIRQAVGEAPYEKLTNPAMVEGKMKFTQGLRETIEDQAPAVDGVNPIAAGNERLGRLFELEDAMVNPTVHSGGGAGSVAMQFATGHPIAAIGSAIAKTAPMASSIGRKVAGLGELIDPRSYMRAPGAPIAAMTHEPPPLSRTLDELGIPEIPGAPWQPDQLDALGIPTERAVLSSEDAWLRKLADDTPPAISHTGTPGATGALGLPPKVQPTSLDELGIPASGESFQPNALDRLDIPEMRPMHSSEDLWMQSVGQLPAATPATVTQPLTDQLRTGTYGATQTPVPTVTFNAPLTKSAAAGLTKAQAKAQGYISKLRQQP